MGALFGVILSFDVSGSLFASGEQAYMATKRANSRPSGKENAEGGKITSAAVLDASQASAPYVVFARRFRPNTFAEVAGQTAVTNALRQALKTGRLHQAYLFCGPRGVGKTSLARIMAKSLNCLKGSGPGGMAEEPCNSCDSCIEIQEGHSFDVVEMDAATNRGIEEIRSLRDNVGLAPAKSRFKVYIIDEVHMLTKEAWNAFLKTLEEPPAHVKFVFATTDPNNVPETILSRCQRYDLRRIGPADIIRRLKQICEMEKVEFEEMALSRIASLSRGGLRDAEGLLDQAVNLGSGKVTDSVVRDLSGAAPDELVFEMLTSCAKGQTGEVLTKTHAALEAGADPDDMLESMVERLRATLLAKVCGVDSPLLEGQLHLKNLMTELGTLLSEDQILMLIQLFTAARRQARDAAQARLPLEMALIRASRAGDLVELGKLVKAMESAAANGTAPRPGAASPPTREGPRPNSQGRSTGDEFARPAAAQMNAPAPRQSAEVTENKGSGGSGSTDGDAWSRVLASMKTIKGGAFLHGALTHARTVRFDADAGILHLGFTADQLLYSDALEKEHNRAALQNACKELFGRDFNFSVARVNDATERREIVAPATPARVAAQPAKVVAPRIVPARAAPAVNRDRPEDANIEEDAGETDTEVEFDEPGALPLPAVSRPEVESAEEQEAPMPPIPVASAKPERMARPATDPATLKSIAEHPLVQMILKETGGTVMNVIRTAPRKAKEPAKE
jgi:DNA polymerase-3 subunit gamma/tau